MQCSWPLLPAVAQASDCGRCSWPALRLVLPATSRHYFQPVLQPLLWPLLWQLLLPWPVLPDAAALGHCSLPLLFAAAPSRCSVQCSLPLLPATAPAGRCSGRCSGDSSRPLLPAAAPAALSAIASATFSCSRPLLRPLLRQLQLAAAPSHPPGKRSFHCSQLLLPAIWFRPLIKAAGPGRVPGRCSGPLLRPVLWRLLPATAPSRCFRPLPCPLLLAADSCHYS